MKAIQRAVRRPDRRRIDDSPEAVEARINAFIDRTCGWGSQAIKSELPDHIVVLAGPTKANPRFIGGFKVSRGRDVVIATGQSRCRDKPVAKRGFGSFLVLRRKAGNK
ncbi:hypothetical protein FAZ95_37295 [Trinickia violacea]|uniref:Uncharacterized protein n=1 Tax=Trinickia violacea TaxID=2571746 RepID=A0A4P8IYN3_9BURK|nr:hypothetical protein [Trinickia violacea]QCP54538.1 hypothetical protein FAZ95_37295 [Trinickia violacea]